jgi:uncharacterized protein
MAFPVPICRSRLSHSASTLLILLPAALWVTSITDGRAGLRALFARVFRWRFGIGWRLVVLFGLPVIGLLLGLIFGGSLQTTDVGPALINNSARSCWLSW